MTKEKQIKKCITVIPIYKEKHDKLEVLSLKQYNTIMHNYDVCIVHPKSLDVESYKTYLDTNNVFDIGFDDNFFSNIKQYSQLCLDYDFYNTFSDYEYILIYQPDCWVFNDTLEEWCDKGYDYIGGPIYSKLSNWPSVVKGGRPAVGNGGLSLRKISTMLKITDRNGYVYNKKKDIWDKVEYEDMFICDGISQLIYLNIPNYKEAEKFSYDCLPVKFDVDKAANEIFGCHRVFTMGRVWKKVIPELQKDEYWEIIEKLLKKFLRIDNSFE